MHDKQATASTDHGCFLKSGFLAMECDISYNMETTQDLIYAVGCTVVGNTYFDISREYDSQDVQRILHTMKGKEDDT